MNKRFCRDKRRSGRHHCYGFVRVGATWNLTQRLLCSLTEDMNSNGHCVFDRASGRLIDVFCNWPMNEPHNHNCRVDMDNHASHEQLDNDQTMHHC